MPSFSFPSLSEISATALMEILNEDSIRSHLIDHPPFDEQSIAAWVADKDAADRSPGCRVRAVLIDGELAGWMGIQPDVDGHELAIVITQRFWGLGISLFRVLMQWAAELEHKEVVFHLLDSRREYKALQRMAARVTHTEWSGRRFTSYWLPVPRND